MVGQFCSGCLVDMKARFFLGLGVHPIHSVQAPFVPLQPFVPLGALGVSTPLIALRHPGTVSIRIFFHFQDSRLYSHPWQVPSLLFTLGSRWSFSCVFSSNRFLLFLSFFTYVIQCLGQFLRKILWGSLADLKVFQAFSYGLEILFLHVMFQHPGLSPSMPSNLKIQWATITVVARN